MTNAVGQIDRWIARLNDPSMAGRGEATAQLASMGGEALPSLISAARGTWTNRFGVPCVNDGQIRRGAIIALGRGAAVDGIPALIELASEPSLDVVLRWEAIDALSVMGSPARTALPVLQKLAMDADPHVRASAQRALERIAALP